MTDEQYKEIAKAYFEKHKIPYGKFWEVQHHSGRITVWFWRASEDRLTNPHCTMDEDGGHPYGYR